ncbi:MAG TPA: glycosyltransferase [Dermatophilaceae bacterium]|nr:glycosyltransferase [Dermatophilaceae bacterium]
MPEPAIGYVLKGYPRMSELFIASEIWRLEQLGVPLRLYVLTPADEQVHHDVVHRIRAVPTYLPAATSLSGTTLRAWLRANLPGFAPALRRVARRHPVRLAAAAATAAAQSWRSRTRWRPRTVYVKELLQAVALADLVTGDEEVGHLHAHFAHGATTVTWLAARICGIPFSFTGHAKDIYRPSLNPAGLLRRKLEAARFVVTCTGANADHLRAVAPGADVQLAYHGLNADFARLLGAPGPPAGPAAGSAAGSAAGPPAGPAAGPAAGGLHVVSVGRFVQKKGFDTLLEAVAQLRDRGVGVRLTLVGEPGDASATVSATLRRHHLAGQVRVRGAMSQPELLDLYRSADVFALACRVLDDGDRDGIPNVLVEAMAAGLPVVSTGVSGIPELVQDGVNGLLVPPDDPAALADALSRLADDRRLRARLAGAGAATVAEHYDGDLLARRMAGLLLGRTA